MVFKRRTYTDIFSDILWFCSKDATKTQILYGCNLNSLRLTEHLNALICMELLVKEVKTWKTVYKTTTQGKQFLINYSTKKTNAPPSLKPFKKQVKNSNKLQPVTSTSHLIVDSLLVLYNMEAGET